MARACASRTAAIPAPADAVYSLIADYRHGHARMLPPAFFPRLEVERGGTGDGTLIRFEFRLFGRTRVIRAEVSEPEPGSRLVETDLETGARTSFGVTPSADGLGCEVTIRTEWEARGPRGWVERILAPPMLRRVYGEQLSRLRGLFEPRSAR